METICANSIDMLKKIITQSSLGPPSRSDGSITNDPQEKSENLNNYVSSVFTADNGDNVHFPHEFKTVLD